jgi:glycosyltransferase involved in cell wall biosynthesis
MTKLARVDEAQALPARGARPADRAPSRLRHPRAGEYPAGGARRPRSLRHEVHTRRKCWAALQAPGSPGRMEAATACDASPSGRDDLREMPRLMVKRIKVLVVCNRLRETQAPIQHFMRLDDRRFEVVVCSHMDSTEQAQALLRGIHPAASPKRCLGLDAQGPFYGRADTGSWLRFMALLRRERVDILQVMQAGSAQPAMLCARAMRVPVVVHFQGTMLDRFAVLNRLVKSAFLSLADADVCCSDAVRGSTGPLAGILTSHVNRVVIRNGVPVDAIDGAAAARDRTRSELGVDPQHAVIVAVGRLEPVKNQSTLMTAMSSVIARLPHAKLVVVGGGPLRASLQATVEALGLVDSVILAGPVPTSRVYEFLHASDLFVLPSLVEGLGVALIEAMAAGIPCVASDLPATRELITDGESGCLVDPRSPHAIADAIVRLLTDSTDAARLASAARRSAVQRFGIDSAVAEYESLYETLLAAS